MERFSLEELFCCEPPTMAELGPKERGPSEHSLTEIGPSEIDPTKIGHKEISPTEIGLTHLHHRSNRFFITRIPDQLCFIEKLDNRALPFSIHPRNAVNVRARATLRTSSPSDDVRRLCDKSSSVI